MDALYRILAFIFVISGLIFAGIFIGINLGLETEEVSQIETIVGAIATVSGIISFFFSIMALYITFYFDRSTNETTQRVTDKLDKIETELSQLGQTVSNNGVVIREVKRRINDSVLKYQDALLEERAVSYKESNEAMEIQRNEIDRLKRELSRDNQETDT